MNINQKPLIGKTNPKHKTWKDKYDNIYPSNLPLNLIPDLTPVILYEKYNTQSKTPYRKNLS